VNPFQFGREFHNALYIGFRPGPVEQDARVGDRIAQSFRGLADFYGDSRIEGIEFSKSGGGRVRKYENRNIVRQESKLP